jgi:hypothetical protein
MSRLLLAAIACVLASAGAAVAQNASRKLVVVQASSHDPLYIDMASVQRRGTSITFKYILDVFVEVEGKSGWKSNEVEAMIDCAQKTFTVRRGVAYPGPRATGTATGVHSFMAPTPKPEKIAPKSTFAHLEDHLCRNAEVKG